MTTCEHAAGTHPFRHSGHLLTMISDKKICRKCWKFLAIAVKILDTVLRGNRPCYLGFTRALREQRISPLKISCGYSAADAACIAGLPTVALGSCLTLRERP